MESQESEFSVDDSSKRGDFGTFYHDPLRPILSCLLMFLVKKHQDSYL